MKDSSILAFSLAIRFRKKGKPTVQYDHVMPLIDIWHYQEPDGATDWSYPHLTKKEKAKAADLITNEVDNLRHWMQDCHVGVYNDRPYADDVSDEEMIHRMQKIFRIYKGVNRKWYQHPKWRFWQWRIQVFSPLKQFRDFKKYVLAKHGWNFQWQLRLR
ncbi:hypothetical protein [Spirosoma aerolatum]|uniref:hypothetical protein n=1 Tax=Spirosoma aerolatum TaxID=1211326 RepID=UPI0009AE478D|nr:hypothetical protein [Spirosoma aerolatum]